MKVAVVGSGIVGISAARFLSKRRHDVTLFEQFPLFHTLGSSHGRTRIVRRAYADPFYTACMMEAYPLWADLEADANCRLVNEVGLLYFGDADGERVRSVIAGLDECQVPFQTFDSQSVKSVFPRLQLEAHEVGVFTPEAGWVDAAAAARVSTELATSYGMQVVQAKPSQEDLARDFDAFVVAPGGWIRDWVDVPVRVTMETFGYAQVQVEGPVWIDDTDFAYGFPSDELGLKLGAHLNGYPIDASNPSREPSPVAMDLVVRKVEQRFGVRAEVQHWTGCLYTSTATQDFLLGRLGANGFFASACSGHGFKTGPWIGKLLADFAEGNAKPEDHPRFFWSG